MADNYYGAIAVLAWIFGHYFYHGEHYVWLAEEYYPYRLPNPKSSNPHLVYADLYQPWKDRDDHDKFIQSLRLNLRKGVIAKESAGKIDPHDAARLKTVCDKVDITFLYPIVLKVDIDNVKPVSRHKKAGSALAGSSEILVEDLNETEFDIIFLDYESDPAFKQLVVDEINGISPSVDVLTTLEGRC
jgi:hypothetical protein